MQYIQRNIEHVLNRMLKPGKVVILTGARRVGKTELATHISNQYGESATILNGEDFEVKEMLANRKSSHYKRLFKDKQLLIIDEAQTVREIGPIAKLIVDEMDEIRLLLTGSSSFHLIQSTGEPLTGRKTNLNLFPFSLGELEAAEGLQTIQKELDQHLIYGSYPELNQLERSDEKEAYLKEIARSYLLKDILYLSSINNPDKLMKLLRLIAWQTGSEVSYHEVGRQLGMSKNTVERYLHLLAHVFVLFQVKPFSKNLRKEVSKSSKWYYVDNGIRNAVINQFGLLHERNDIGALWENFVMAEWLKKGSLQLNPPELHFWRTYDGQEIDLIKRSGNNIEAFEIKLSLNRPVHPPAAFQKAYPDVKFSVIHRGNIFEWVEA